MTLVCEACGSHEITTIEATHNPGSGFERYECENCGGTGALQYDATTGPTFTGCVTRDLHDAETGYGTGGRPIRIDGD